MRVCLLTFGCQMNVYDSERVAGLLAAEGAAFTETPDDADLIVINTCSVRQHAEERVHSNLGKFRAWKRRKLGRRLAVIGCMAQREGARIAARFPHVDLIVGTRMLDEFPRLLEAASNGAATPLLALDEKRDVDFGSSPARRPVPHRAYLAIMRGCDKRCTYCVVPSARGPEVSRSMDDVESEARRLTGDGAREVVLLGQTIDSYGSDRGDGTSLEALLRRLHPLPGLDRLRFITNHPCCCREDLFRAMAELGDKVMPFIHMPAQSGSDRVLKRMARRYTRARYLELLDAARRLCPEIEVASDFIVGFPGETDEDFEATLSLVREARFQSCYLFKYSPRPGTAAARLADDVPDAVKRDRHAALMKAQAAVSLELNRARIGREEEVLVDGVSKTDDTRMAGRSRGHRIVVFPGAPDLAGKIVRVRIESTTALTLSGVRG